MDTEHQPVDAKATLSVIVQSESFWCGRKEEVCKIIKNVSEVSTNNTPTSHIPLEQDSVLILI